MPPCKFFGSKNIHPNTVFVSYPDFEGFAKQFVIGERLAIGGELGYSNRVEEREKKWIKNRG